MTPIRCTFILSFLCLFAGIRGAQAQCSANVVTTNAICFGQSDGSINLTASNGTAPYTYAWSNGLTTEDLSGLVAGAYTCTVTDISSCTATVSATVSQPSQLTVVIANVTLNCMTPTGSLEANVSGGVPPYQYLWSNGETTNSPQIQQPGVYGLTVTDANGCTATSSGYVLVDANVPVACISPAPTLTCDVTSVTLDASCSSAGPFYVYFWTTSNGAILTGANTITPTIAAPGVYTLLVVNNQNGCTSVTSINVTEDNFPFPAHAGPDLEIPCGGGFVTLYGESIDGNVAEYNWTTVSGNIVSGANTTSPVVDQSGVYIFTVTNLTNGCTSSDNIVVVSNSNATGLCSSIKGHVLQDTLGNCIADAGEPPLSGWIVKAEGLLGAYFAVTDVNGAYEVFVEPGDTYTISAFAPSTLWLHCPAIPDVVVTNPNESLIADDLLFQKLAGCAALSVDISSGNLRRCFSNNFFNVLYCNYGTEPALDAYIEVTLDTFLSIVSSSVPYTDLGGGVLRFEVGYLAIGECDHLYFSAYLSCDAVLGQTHCTEAHIYPDSSCIPANPQWSGASLRISSDCQSDSVRFTIKNVGAGNMTSAVDYVVIEDQVMLMSAPVQLDAGEFITASVPANGSTWRLEVSQVPFHPGQSAPAVSVEGCTIGSTFSTGFVTQFAADDADEFIDIECKENTASSDPNDKQGFPKGYGAEHYIRPGTPLEYLIRFQNTGNDTAFTVRVLDTISAWLDPTTIRPGASSHPYSWDLNGAGVLSFLFEHILLPDSNVNEPASHGFIKFTVNPRSDAPLETVIENTAEIYFDFNDAIVTNTTFHRLGEHFITVGLWQPQQSGYEVLVTPNPFSEAARLEVKGLHGKAPLRLQVFDLQGKLQIEMDSEDAVFHLKKGGLPGGVYLFKIQQAGVNVGSGKLMIQD